MQQRPLNCTHVTLFHWDIRNADNVKFLDVENAFKLLKGSQIIKVLMAFL